MMTKQTPAIVVLSDHLYRLLLWLYPAEHRREYGPLMAQVFRDQCRTAYLRDGAWGVLWVWFPLMVDLAVTLIEEHRRKRFSMSKESFTRFSSPLLMLGGLAWALSSYSQLQPGSHYSYWGLYQLSIAMISPGFLLTGAGLIGLQMRYGTQLGRIGQAGLIVAVLGAAISAVGLFLMTFLEATWWNLFIISYFLHFGGLLVFGIAALRMMGNRNWLPIIVSIIGLLPMTGLIQAESGGFTWRTFVIILVVGVVWIAYGFSLRANRTQAQSVRI